MKVKNLFSRIADGKILINTCFDKTNSAAATTVFASLVEGHGLSPIRVCEVDAADPEKKYFALPGESMNTIFALARCGIVNKTGQYCAGPQTFGPGAGRFALLEGLTYQDLCAVLNGKTTVRNSKRILKEFAPDKECIENLENVKIQVKHINEHFIPTAFSADFPGKNSSRIQKLFVEEKGGTTQKWKDAMLNQSFAFLPGDSLSTLQSAMALVEIKKGKRASLEDVAKFRLSGSDEKILKAALKYCYDQNSAYSFTMFAAIFRALDRSGSLFFGSLPTIESHIETAVDKCVDKHGSLLNYRGRFSHKKMELLSTAFTDFLAEEEGLL